MLNDIIKNLGKSFVKIEKKDRGDSPIPTLL